MLSPKRLASSLLKAFEQKTSVSADDIRTLKEKSDCIVAPSIIKTQSCGGEGQQHLGSQHCNINEGYSNSVRGKSQTMPIVRPRIRFSYYDTREYYYYCPNTYDSFEPSSYNLALDQLKPSTKITDNKRQLVRCKNDLRELKTKIDQFKKEFQETIKSLEEQIKEDEIRYTSLCYVLHHVSDLRQAGLQNLQLLIDKLEEDDNDKEEDTCNISMINDKIRVLESRLREF